MFELTLLCNQFHLFIQQSYNCQRLYVRVQDCLTSILSSSPGTLVLLETSPDVESQEFQHITRICWSQVRKVKFLDGSLTKDSCQADPGKLTEQEEHNSGVQSNHDSFQNSVCRSSYFVSAMCGSDSDVLQGRHVAFCVRSMLCRIERMRVRVWVLEMAKL